MPRGLRSISRVTLPLGRALNLRTASREELRDRKAWLQQELARPSVLPHMAWYRACVDEIASVERELALRRARDGRIADTAP
jgi:hypothetical protein